MSLTAWDLARLIKENTLYELVKYSKDNIKQTYNEIIDLNRTLDTLLKPIWLGSSENQRLSQISDDSYCDLLAFIMFGKKNGIEGGKVLYDKIMKDPQNEIEKLLRKIEYPPILDYFCIPHNRIKRYLKM
jgi:hypothetical protein